MENAPAFNLETAVGEWRNSLRGSPALHTADLDELETHLRDAVLTLVGEGYTSEEAFRIARQRLGRLWKIEREYAKVNSGRVWMDRSVWMLAGLLLYKLVQWCSNAASGLAVHTLVTRLNPHWVGFLSTVAGYSVMALIVMGFWRVVTQQDRALGKGDRKTHAEKTSGC